ncbi:MAG: hypothetical protein KAW67_01420, partial [Candidatus Eisenbacteria sp.]|nr:hypothetical protein [Candidatus Eisenbacteria bacterium]
MKNRAASGAIALVVVAGLLLGLFTTSAHVKARGFDYIEHGEQFTRHQDLMEGRAGNPWQYRVLAPYMVNGALKLLERLHVPRHVAASFVGFRVILDTLVLLLAFAYYRKLGLSLPFALIGMAILAWGMSYSHYNSDLQFSTFFGIIFYLLAGLCIRDGRFVWIVTITVLAAFNRETSALIPFMLLGVAMLASQQGSVRKVLPVFATALAAYVAIFVGLRLAYGSQEFIAPYGHYPGLDLLWFNLSRRVTWWQLIATLSVVPVVAALGYRTWPDQLRAFFWVVVPVWFVVHAFGSVMAETRLLLVPQAMVFVPGALLYLAHQARRPS